MVPPPSSVTSSSNGHLHDALLIKVKITLRFVLLPIRFKDWNVRKRFGFSLGKNINTW